MSHPVSQHSQPQRRKLQLRFIVIELEIGSNAGQFVLLPQSLAPPSQKRPAAALPQHIEAAPHPPMGASDDEQPLSQRLSLPDLGSAKAEEGGRKLPPSAEAALRARSCASSEEPEFSEGGVYFDL